MQYIPALKLWNQSKGYVKGGGHNWCVPTKGSTGHAELMNIMKTGKAPKKRILLGAPVAPVVASSSSFVPANPAFRAPQNDDTSDDEWIDDGAPITGGGGLGGAVSAANERQGDVFDDYEAAHAHRRNLEWEVIKKAQLGARRKRGMVEVGNRTMRGQVRTKPGFQLPTRKIGYWYDTAFKGDTWNSALV